MVVLDRVHLARISRREHEKGTCPLSHTSCDASADREPCLLDPIAVQRAKKKALAALRQQLVGAG